MHFVYILQSEKDLSYYIGEAPDVEKRLKFHNQGGQRYTKARIPWKLMYKEEFNNRHAALLREREIKKKKSKKYIEWLIKSQIAG